MKKKRQSARKRCRKNSGLAIRLTIDKKETKIIFDFWQDFLRIGPNIPLNQIQGRNKKWLSIMIFRFMWTFRTASRW